MIRQRIRIRFSKSGDLRLISHRDLVRVWERLFRRAGLRLSMSEGFHPKPKMNFPSALGLGIVGRQEVMEVELAEEADPEELSRRLASYCPPGLQILEVAVRPPGAAKPEVVSMTYEIAVPASRCAAAAEAIENLLSSPQVLIQRAGRQEPLDLRTGIDSLRLERGALRIRLLASRTASARPREVLEVLGLDDLEQQGAHLTRAAVELAAEPGDRLTDQPQKEPPHEKGNAD